MKKQAGFTLIELVMVIVILGILAAVALPKFVNLSGDARKATLAGAEGAVHSAANMTHGASLAAGSNTVSIEGVSYTLVNNYPSAANIATLAGITGAGYTTTVAGSVATIGVTGASNAATCNFTYTEAAANAAPVITAASANNAGC
jgi:MSHA pilin protein MshA